MRASLFFSFTSCHSRFFLVRAEQRRGLSRVVPTRPSTSDILNRESTRPRQGLIGGSRVRERGTGERERDLPACVFFFFFASSLPRQLLTGRSLPPLSPSFLLCALPYRSLIFLSGAGLVRDLARGRWIRRMKKREREEERASKRGDATERKTEVPFDREGKRKKTSTSSSISSSRQQVRPRSYQQQPAAMNANFSAEADAALEAVRAWAAAAASAGSPLSPGGNAGGGGAATGAENNAAAASAAAAAAAAADLPTIYKRHPPGFDMAQVRGWRESESWLE